MSVSFHVESSPCKHKDDLWIDIQKYPYTLYTGVFVFGFIPGYIHTPPPLSSLNVLLTWQS